MPNILYESEPNFIEDGLKRLPYQFKTSEKMRAFMSIFLQETQNLFDVFQDLSIKRQLEKATDIQLDELGLILGLRRSANMGDRNYRFLLNVQIMINNCDMRVENTLDILRLIFPSAEIEYICTTTLEATYKIKGSFTPQQVILMRQLPKTLGIDNIDYQDVDNEENLFAFAQDPIGKGFGTIHDPDVGGYFASLL